MNKKITCYLSNDNFTLLMRKLHLWQSLVTWCWVAHWS
jgi:hypothetical protein